MALQRDCPSQPRTLLLEWGWRAPQILGGFLPLPLTPYSLPESSLNTVRIAKF